MPANQYLSALSLALSRPRQYLLQSIVVSDASAGSFMVTLDFTASGGSVQTSGEIAYNAGASGSRSSVKEILEVCIYLSSQGVRVG